MIKLLIGVDYELYFGSRHGTVARCMLEPTAALADVIEKHGVSLTLFVDIGFLARLRCDQRRHAVLGREADQIAAQLQQLCARGHDVQLHVHPHWEDSSYDGGGWRINTDRYRLHDFAEPELTEIVSRYCRCLEEETGRTAVAYRAGGWCLQPFEALVPALRANGVWIDSTVYVGGLSSDTKRWFDFRNAPDRAWWRFGTDPLRPVERGDFVEMPISGVRVSPAHYLGAEMRRRVHRSAHASFGDGAAMRASIAFYVERLLKRSVVPASVDGAKALLLDRALRRVRRKGHEILNVMGHPKALTRASLAALDDFLSRHRFEAHTFSSLASEF